MTKQRRTQGKRRVTARGSEARTTGRAHSKTQQKETLSAPRRSYRKPEIEKVPLVLGEVAQTGCKIPGGAGPETGACNTKGGADKCFEFTT
jgi:hypothetical protein